MTVLDVLGGCCCAKLLDLGIQCDKLSLSLCHHFRQRLSLATSELQVPTDHDTPLILRSAS